MRLWSVHPKYLDVKGLGGQWVEAIIAKNTLTGKSSGWKNHPELDRFRKNPQTINDFLRAVWEEGVSRGYDYKEDYVGEPSGQKIEVKKEDLIEEFNILLSKLEERAPKKFRELRNLERVESNPVFVVSE